MDSLRKGMVIIDKGDIFLIARVRKHITKREFRTYLKIVLKANNNKR